MAPGSYFNQVQTGVMVTQTSTVTNLPMDFYGDYNPAINNVYNNYVNNNVFRIVKPKSDYDEALEELDILFPTLPISKKKITFMVRIRAFMNV